MDMIQITIELSADDAAEAEAFGLLDPEAIAQVLRAELDARIMAMVNAEVQAHRDEKRQTESQERDV